ncbi:MMPL family transporter [Mycobacterium riyadhense]|uniref:Membrane protein YdfJ n=1 Tax=Mycobacterium riyadhense TaxID=486698 RepID=A0A653F101_9MYCO|nr:MMPL family transporter [Mycobacterium riyadhense]VTP02851.1 Membrane protein YdfJ [Mycobacterium riyadhense]
MLQGIARLAIAAPRRVIGAALLIMFGAGVFGFQSIDALLAGGYQDPSSPSSQAQRLLAEKFNYGDMEMIVAVTCDTGVQSDSARTVAADIVTQLKASPDVTRVDSAWTDSPPLTQDLTSRDGKTGLIVAGVTGGETGAPKRAQALADRLVRDRGGVIVRAGGEAIIAAQSDKQLHKDLLITESIAIPLSFVALVWVFGGLVASAIPLAISGFTTVGTLAALRAITFAADVSIFALNIAMALSLALAIDYTLLIISRYRDERAEGVDRDHALIRTMASAGRTVLFSATTVGLSLATLVVFPMYFLKSFAYAGVAVVLLGAVAAVVITPAAIVVLGDRLNSMDLRQLVGRLRGRPGPVPRPVEESILYRSTKAIMRRPIPFAVAVTALLLVLGAPFLGAKWGFPDERVLPQSTSARQVGDMMRSDFDYNVYRKVTMVIPDTRGVTPNDLNRYAAQLSQVPDVLSVIAPGGIFISGSLVAPPPAFAKINDGSAILSASSAAPLFSAASQEQLDRMHAVPGPGGRIVQFTGTAEINRDSVQAITSRIPLVLCLIGAIMYVLLFLLTGSVVLPLKALVLNVLSVTAAFGALVWIFQDGHLAALGTTPNGTLVVTTPVLLFCMAFGLSMDYEVFLVSRIREYWLASSQTPEDNDEAVALGLARSGRVVTAAALLMAIPFATQIPAQMSSLRMYGLGLTLAVVMDATLVRMVLLPAFMRVMGRANWWAPKPLARLHARIGIAEGGDVQ